MVLAMSYLRGCLLWDHFQERTWPCSPFKPMAALTEGDHMRRTNLTRSAAPVAAVLTALLMTAALR